MRVTSVNVGAVKEIGTGSHRVASGFRKQPVHGPVTVTKTGLAGDAQGDPVRHGGPEKTIYVYPSEHYAFWAVSLERHDLAPGAFGENLTVEGWTEPETRPGDVYLAGSAEVVVTRPRFPCYKMDLVFERPTILREFLESGRSGFYLGVRREGTIRAGDSIVRHARGPDGPSIADIVARTRREQDEALSSQG